MARRATTESNRALGWSAAGLVVVRFVGAVACAVISGEGASPGARGRLPAATTGGAGGSVASDADLASSGRPASPQPRATLDSRDVDGSTRNLLRPEAARTIPVSAIEDPSGQALGPFFDALGRVAVGEPGSRAAIVQLGDSHTAADLLSGTVRRGLQHRFGDAGRGFVFPGTPFKHYHQMDVKHGGGGPWTVQNGLKSDAVEPLGLGGIRLTGSSPQATIYAGTCDTCDINSELTTFEILFWRHSTGGWFQVMIDGEPYRVVDTRSGPLVPEGIGSTGYFRIDLPDGPHRLELHSDGEGAIDLFGIIMERDAPGVTYDALGLNGAWAGTPVRWTWELAGEQLAHRDANLLMTWYGTNETSLTGFDVQSYADTYRRLLERLKLFAPEASCLVLGPPDRVVQARRKCPPRRLGRDGLPLSVPAGCAWEPPPVLDQIIAIQRTVAFEQGCAFWDVRRAMGGVGAIDAWVDSTPPLAQADRVHLTREGYEQVGEALLNDLTAEYDYYSSMMSRMSVPEGSTPPRARAGLSEAQDAVQQR